MLGRIVRIGATGAGALLAVGLLVVPPAGADGSGKHGKTEERSAKATSTCFDTSGKTQGRSDSDPDGMANGGADKPGCTGGFDADRDGNNGCGNDADREDDNNGRCGGKAQRNAQVRNAKDDRAKDDRAKDDRAKDDRAKDDRTEVDAEVVKAEADRKARCGDKDRRTTTTTGETEVSAAGSAKECSCPKTPDVAGASASTADSKLEAAAALPAARTEVTVNGTSAEQPTVAAAGATGATGTEATTADTAPETQVLGETLERPSALARTGAGVGTLALLGGLLCGGGRLTSLARRFLRID